MNATTHAAAPLVVRNGLIHAATCARLAGRTGIRELRAVPDAELATTRPAGCCHPVGAAEAIEQAAHRDQLKDAAKARRAQVRTCTSCHRRLPLTRFPTTHPDAQGVMRRSRVCRACRDARRAERTDS